VVMDVFLSAFVAGGSTALALWFFQGLPDWSKALIIVAAMFLSGWVSYRRDYLPSLKVKRVAAAEMIETLILPALVARYRNANPGGYELRACVMKARSRPRIMGVIPRMILEARIEFSTSDFAPGEKEITWREGVPPISLQYGIVRSSLRRRAE